MERDLRGVYIMWTVERVWSIILVVAVIFSDFEDLIYNKQSRRECEGAEKRTLSVLKFMELQWFNLCYTNTEQI